VPRGFARPHRPRKLNRAAEQQQFFGQRRLACIRVGNDGKGAATLNVALEFEGGGTGQRKKPG
jgi:hypothetical protein